MSAMVFNFFALNVGNFSTTTATCIDDNELSFVLLDDDCGNGGNGGDGCGAAAASNSPFRLLALFFCLLFLVT